MLLYLVKHTRPDLTNATRELTKVMDGATQAAMKELLRVLKFAIDTKEYGLKVKPSSLVKTDGLWTIELFSDSDYAGDSETRITASQDLSYTFLEYPSVGNQRGRRA